MININNHTKSIFIKILWILMFFALIFFVMPDLIIMTLSGFEKDAVEIDRCLDSGGSWNEDFRTCEKE
jgi:hypothetical protein